MTDQQTSRTNTAEAQARRWAYDAAINVVEAVDPDCKSLGALRKMRDGVAAEPRSDAVTAQPNPSDSASPDEPTLRAAVSAAWAALRNDVLNPDSPFPASVDDLFRVGRYNVERAYDALIEARAAWASPDERTTNPSEVGTPLVVGTAPDEPSRQRLNDEYMRGYNAASRFLDGLIAIERKAAREEARAVSASVPPLDEAKLTRLLPSVMNFRIPLAQPVRHPVWRKIAAELAAAYAAETPEQGRGDEPR